MIRTESHLLQTASSRFAITLLAAAGLAFAQPPSGGWRRVGDPPPVPAPQQQPGPVAQPQSQDPEPVDRSDAYGQVPQNQQQPVQNPQDFPPPPPDQQTPPYNPNAPGAQMNRAPYGLPSSVTLPPGAYMTVRINQPLSSDHNQPGDTFSATLSQPVVVNGVVIAQRGQQVYGRVAEAEKSHSDKPSRLGLELTGMMLADGSQAPIRSQLVGRQGGTTPAGIQAGTIVGTTAVGAAIGAAADYGRAGGAVAGAGIGAAAGIIGVLLTRNHPTVVYPETLLTFRVESPVTVDLTRSPQAFRYVAPNEYERNYGPAQPRPPIAAYGVPAGGYYAYGPGYYPYPYWGYPYYYGGFGVVIGGRGYYGRGYFRRW